MAAGTKPQLNGAASVDTVRATQAMPAEVRGFSLSGASAIDLTTTGAYSVSSTLAISDNMVTGAGAEGMDLNLDS